MSKTSKLTLKSKLGEGKKITSEILDDFRESSKVSKKYIKVGLSTCSFASGADDIYKHLKDKIKKLNIDFEIGKCGCIGACYAEPLLEVKLENQPVFYYQQVNIAKLNKIIEKTVINNEIIDEYILPKSKKQTKIVLRNAGLIDPENIDEYIENDGYQAIKKTLLNYSADEVIKEVEESGLRGRGGAGYPTHLKWKCCKKQNSEQKYIICNADEGDPGAYMDRSVLEGDPHSVIEGMMIAGYAIGCSKGIVYIRAEYPLAIERVQEAINQCIEYGLLGQKILGRDFNFDIEIRLGAGAFVCGEETALIASIEGKRGYPSPRPPYPVESGLWGCPTVINNVETLANIPFIILNGAENFNKIGTEHSKGTKVFALTGKVKNTGLIEVAMGTTLREIIYDIGGGVIDGKNIKAVHSAKAIQTGGPSGGLIPEKYLDVPVSYENLEELGSIMGSGGMIVLDEDDSIVDTARFFMEFCVGESCGKCAPCRIGSTQVLNILNKIISNNGTIDDLNKLEKTCSSMKKASLCGLGQTAPNPVLSSLKYFKDEYLTYIQSSKED